MTSADSLRLFDDRWEQDRLAHSYYLNTDAYSRLSGLAKHIVLKGHRGTGKTTLLRALDWRERLYNEHLGRALGVDPFADRVIGCFLQIKLLPVDMMDIWTRSSNDQVKHIVIATYLRATWLLEVCAALRGIELKRGLGKYEDQVEDLGPSARLTWEWLPARLKLAPGLSDDILTIRDIEAVARALLTRIRDAAAVESPLPETLIAELNLLEFPTIVDSLFRSLAAYASRLDNGGSWSFRICMDEGEFLSDSWANSVRTLIRETDSPVYLAVSVLHSLGSETRAQGASISIDDREIVDLDDRTPEQMITMLNGILQARLNLLGQGSSFDLKGFLGDPSVDDLLRVAVGKSESKTVLSRRHELMNQEHPVRSHLQAIGAVPTASVKERRVESTGYRKKKVAGYLNLLGSLGVDRPVFAGWRIAVNMADNSVRDFIRFLRYALGGWTRDREEPRSDTVWRFLAQSRLDLAYQDEALNSLGLSKLEAMPNTVIRPNETRALVLLLGEVSHRTDFYSKSLKQPNATRLLLPIVRDGLAYSDGDSRLIMLLEEAASYGYISELDVGKDRVSCRVNRSFARYLGFSYWKPQYSNPISTSALRSALANPGGSPSTWLREPKPRRTDAHVQQSFSFGGEDWLLS